MLVTNPQLIICMYRLLWLFCVTIKLVISTDYIRTWNHDRSFD